MSFFRLKDLIRAVRVCKTAADERNVIRRESAAIRTSFKENNSQDARYVNVQKLLYIYLLGFPVQFGQLECLKLAASPRFSDKRVGYLGVTLFLDEKQEILTLLTNSLKSDMNNPDDYIVGLALTTMSCVASTGVANDLMDEVQRLMDSSRSYIRKKAALAAVRVVRRDPELCAPFLERVRSLLGNKHHGVQLAAVALMTELCNHSQEALDEGRKLVPVLVRQLRVLLNFESSSEYEVANFSDPFLQVAILRLMRVIARGSQEAADELNDVLTHVASRTDWYKNAGAAIIYECAVTALAIPSEQPLRVLAINLLGQFLSYKDNNVRYVALATLSAAVITEAPSVQRHRTTVVQCMRDSDISIRRRALDLSFALINAQNIRPMVTDILRVLPVADLEFRSSMVYRLCAAITLFGDSLEWRVERMLRVLCMGGNYVNLRDLFKFIRYIALEADENMQRRVTRNCFALLERDISQDKMVFAGVWLIGEYADLLVTSSEQQIEPEVSDIPSRDSSAGLDADDLDILGALGKPIQDKGSASADGGSRQGSAPPAAMITVDEELPLAIPEPADIVRLLDAILKAHIVSATNKRIALTALVKLPGRFTSQPSIASEIRSVLSRYERSVDCEIQSRATEFDKLLSKELDSVRAGVVERMPAPEYSDVPYEEYVLNPTAMRMKALTLIRRPAIQPADLIGDAAASAENAEAKAQKAVETNKQSVMSDLLNLMDDAPSANADTEPSQPPAQSHQHAPPSSASANALADLLGGATISPTSILSPGSETSANFSSADLDKEYEIYNTNGLRITLTPSKKQKAPAIVEILATFYNSSEMPISDLNFLVAVPKSQKLQIMPPSGQHVSAGSTVTQQVKIANPSKTALRLRMKLAFTTDGRNIERMFDYSGFPSTVV
ncbi:clathrin associated protein complex large subunit [Coemansia sp. RSA 1813]|nr:clathrin associated protein complex large subunit [Coemansia sp. RSA 1646]KAJ1773018.1 clathrin associated protein complex large subunit [Coemansia sp. RSA 1843]KAJ2092206.1 clathrin associated protein complex large subunit [Coemansia sp. RSA 986]KAJ2215342.1 clathrin associated protein complex large subunit [Coemansia sp. RSA 487]KAJ2570321.1 clathrin associated protein complex large subunit [Coemansia sp. RSA 1813]